MLAYAIYYDVADYVGGIVLRLCKIHKHNEALDIADPSLLGKCLKMNKVERL